MLASRGPGPGVLRPVVRGGVRKWQADWTDAAGRRHRKLLGTNRHLAELALAKVVRERDMELMGLVQASGLESAIGDVVDAYLADLATRARPRSHHDAGVMLERAVREMGVRTVREVTRAKVSAWRAKRVASGIAHKTANTEVGYLHAALAYAVELGTIPANPIAGLRGLPVGAKHRKRLPRALTDFEAARLIRAAERHDGTSNGIPRTPLLLALIETGARWGELVATRWADVDFERATVTFRGETTKTQRTRTVPVSTDLLDVLSGYRADQTRILGREPGTQDGIFLAPAGRRFRAIHVSRFREWLYARLDDAKIPRVDGAGRVLHVHALRHTFATRLARAGIPVQLAATLTGHRTVELLMSVYTHLAAEDARAAIRALPSLRRDGNVGPV